VELILPEWLEWLPHLEHGDSAKPVVKAPPAPGTTG
jgi:hypothetical protein